MLTNNFTCVIFLSMKVIINKFKKFVKRQLAKRPSPLPLGITEFNAWSDDIIDTFDLLDNDSVRWSLAVMLLHVDNKEILKVSLGRACMPKAYFAAMVTKAMSNQVVSQVIQDFKEKQAEEAKKAAEESAKSQEATNEKDVASNEHKN